MEEHERLVEGIELHGKDWPAVCRHVGTRSEGATAAYGRTYLEGGRVPRKTKNTKAETRKRTPWTEVEHKLFLKGLRRHGRNFNLVCKVVGTKTRQQVQDHASAYFKRLKREGKGHLIPPKLRQRTVHLPYVRVIKPTITSTSSGDEDSEVAGSSEEVDITQQESESESAGEEKEQARPSCLLCHQLCCVHRKDKQDGHIISWRCKPCKWQGMKAQSAHCSWFANEEDYTAAGLEPGRKRRVCKPWTSVEQANLQIGIYLFGRQWELVARHVGSRTRKQTQDYAYHYFDKLRREGKEGLIPPELSEGKWRAPNEQELKQWLKETGLS